MSTNTGSPFSFDVPEGSDLARFVTTFLAPALTTLNSTAVHKTAVQTLTNKSLGDGTDATKKLGVSLSGATTGKTLTLVSEHSSDRSLALPDATDTLVGRATTDTLTNKTLTSPTITGTVTTTGLTLPAFSAGGTITGTGSSTLTGFGTVSASTLAGTLSSAAQPNVTSLGTLAADLLFADAQHDIGASGATRPRVGYFSSAVAVGTNPAATGALRIPYLGGLLARNSGNSADGTVLSISNATTVQLGGATYTNVQLVDGTKLDIGGAAARSVTAPTNAIDLFDGIAPSGTLPNGVTFYAASGEARVMDAAGNSTLLSPHDAAGLWVFDSVQSVTGKRLRIDMERLLRALNAHFGWDFVQDYVEGSWPR